MLFEFSFKFLAALGVKWLINRPPKGVRSRFLKLVNFPVLDEIFTIIFRLASLFLFPFLEPLVISTK